MGNKLQEHAEKSSKRDRLAANALAYRRFGAATLVGAGREKLLFNVVNDTAYAAKFLTPKAIFQSGCRGR